ncbi:hypothetical protein, partial [Pseudomonas sp. CGJS7]|uniref:hypothetical protein n=1 Tax=Pseudomonas sp. CGJS7 TaxID=3109348 RepID=UPI00300ACABD
MNARIAAPTLCALVLLLSACGEGRREQSRATQPAAAPVAASPAPKFDFAAWVGANADCKGDFFADVQEAAFVTTLRDAGVSASADSFIGEIGPGNATLTSAKPFTLHGLPVQRVVYSFGSGSVFAATVKASAEQARAAISAVQLPEVYRDQYTLGVVTAAPSEDEPTPAIRFVRAGEQAG